MRHLGGFLLFVAVIIVCVWLTPDTKPREYPMWCHNAQHLELSGVCSKIKGKDWWA